MESDVIIIPVDFGGKVFKVGYRPDRIGESVKDISLHGSKADRHIDLAKIFCDVIASWDIHETVSVRQRRGAHRARVKKQRDVPIDIETIGPGGRVPATILIHILATVVCDYAVCKSGAR